MKTIKELGINLTNAFNNASYWNHKGAYQKADSKRRAWHSL